MKPWQRKYQRAITKRLEEANARATWALDLCDIILWYAERHPEAQVDKVEAETARRYIGDNDDVVIAKDKQSFRLRHRPYTWVRNVGLPQIPTSYEEESA
jgi:hypothetical protein